MSDLSPLATRLFLLVVLGAVGAGLGYVVLSGGLKRFQQTSIQCADPLTGPIEIVVNERKAGAQVRLIRPQDDRRLTITAADAQGFSLAYDDFALTVSLDGPELTVIRGQQFSRSRCRMTDFAM